LLDHPDEAARMGAGRAIGSASSSTSGRCACRWIGCTRGCWVSRRSKAEASGMKLDSGHRARRAGSNDDVRPVLIELAGPAGVGKTTLRRELLTRDPTIEFVGFARPGPGRPLVRARGHPAAARLPHRLPGHALVQSNRGQGHRTAPRLATCRRRSVTGTPDPSDGSGPGLPTRRPVRVRPARCPESGLRSSARALEPRLGGPTLALSSSSLPPPRCCSTGSERDRRTTQ
jgi:hypothetical protein